jgi:D-alanyl-D-alanine carboxypeptidase
MSNGGYQNGKLPDSALAPIKAGSLQKEQAAAWNAMNAEARANGCELRPTGSASSYRTYQQQVDLYNAYLNGTGNLAAVPGTSNHGWGTAVDLATTDMRSMVDRIGAKYGYSKSWSDAPSEWWHICYQAGHYSGPDPGSDGAGAPDPDLDVMGAATCISETGTLHVFAEMSDGSIYYTYQPPGSHGWNGGEAGKRIAGLAPFAPAPGK